MIIEGCFGSIPEQMERQSIDVLFMRILNCTKKCILKGADSTQPRAAETVTTLPKSTIPQHGSIAKPRDFSGRDMCNVQSKMHDDAWLKILAHQQSRYDIVSVSKVVTVLTCVFLIGFRCICLWRETALRSSRPLRTTLHIGAYRRKQLRSS